LVLDAEDYDQLHVGSVRRQAFNGRVREVVSLQRALRIKRKEPEILAVRPSQSEPRRMTIVRSEDAEVDDTTRNHLAGDSSLHLFRNDNNRTGEMRGDSAPKSMKHTGEKHVTPVESDEERSAQPNPRRKRRYTVMSVEDVVRDFARLPQDLECAT